MRKHALSAALLLATVTLVLTSCKEDEKKEGEAAGTSKSAEQAQPETEPAPPPAETPEAAAATGDYIKVLASHSEPKPDDPVEVSLPVFEVVKADFDPKNLEGATAEIEVDLSKLESDSDKRDTHLKSPDYLDVAQFGTARVVVDEVEKGEGQNAYTASAKVKVHGVEVKWPVEFRVVETRDDAVVVEAKKEFERTEFEVGKVEGDPVAKPMAIQLRLTFQKT